MNIAISKGNTNACINATKIACKCRITGPIIGKSNPIRLVVPAESAQTNITINNQPDVTFPNNLNDNEIIFAP
jgi:hypothetical protein